MMVPPAGELGLLKRMQKLNEPGTESSGNLGVLGTLLDYLAPNTILLCCEAEQLQLQGEDYERQVSGSDPLFISWSGLRAQASARGMTILDLKETEVLADWSESRPLPLGAGLEMPEAGLEELTLPMVNALRSGDITVPWRPADLQSLEAFRPMGDRPPEPQVAQAQRKEFFAQIHHWLRRDFAVHLFCNNDGERQRFIEIWQEYGLETPAPVTDGHATRVLPGLTIHLGSLARGFLSERAKAVVVTDAEIFGRYKVQRPRRLKSPHAQAARSALDIDFTDLEDGDYVVHLQHGIGRYRRSEARNV